MDLTDEDYAEDWNRLLGRSGRGNTVDVVVKEYDLLRQIDAAVADAYNRLRNIDPDNKLLGMVSGVDDGIVVFSERQRAALFSSYGSEDSDYAAVMFCYAAALASVYDLMSDLADDFRNPGSFNLAMNACIDEILRTGDSPFC